MSSFSLNTFFNAVNYALTVSNYQDFFLRVKQYKVLEAALSGRDVIAILPTGYGKSVIFHLLPYLFDYISKLNESPQNSIIFVVTPLNALVDDQLKILTHRGISSTVLKSKKPVSDADEDCDSDSVDNEKSHGLTNDSETLGKLKEGKCRIIFSHPEAFISCKEGRMLLLSKVYQDRVMACVIDEAHLVEEWGFDFRPDFANLSQLVSIFPAVPILALTATAPKKNCDSLTKALNLEKPCIVKADLDRPNIFLHKEKRKAASSGVDSYDSILYPIAKDLKKKLADYPLTLIYLPLKWCGYAFKLFLDILGDASYFPINADKIPENCLFGQFHAPQTEQMKQQMLKQLTCKSSNSTIRVVFATIAIGIGVNIPSIRQVIHIGAPRTLESYYQQIGRGGRDGKSTKACLYYNGQDIAANKPGMTDEMRNFCLDESECLRKRLLTYLGSSGAKSRTDGHSCCSNCLRKCHCAACSKSTSTALTDLAKQQSSVEPIPSQPFRTVSDEQRCKIASILKQYRIHLGTTRQRFGSIDLATGFTQSLINCVVENCEYIDSVDHVLLAFNIWDVSHAHTIVQVIHDVCGQ
ncbi:PREDICTED: Werner syndrome ATP-dependent helicase homolog [Acropora digitifera]|uniref:Werner syndrome ATP-dependent helicase homolog n=1 Tax=Acropora digitifera TaxID=70779 RepID=UPI00077A433D|nr:PREDICTED: Werner syndrome ATP-dependent helicase homolog [Acropora digitifera]